MEHAAYPPINEPNTAPPEKTELMAPMMLDAGSVLKYFRKFGELITSVITPASYPNKNDLSTVSDSCH
jgi:hypothetical protein